MDELFGAAVGRLAEHPLTGRPGQVPGTRELIPHESYRLVYEAQADTVLSHIETAATR
jgi:plasmid stabilization system protein ParE